MSYSDEHFEHIVPQQPKLSKVVGAGGLEIIFERLSYNSWLACESLFERTRKYAAEHSGGYEVIYKPFQDIKAMLANFIIYGINVLGDLDSRDPNSLIGMVSLRKMVCNPENEVAERKIETIPVTDIWKYFFANIPIYYAGSLILDPNFRGKNLGDFLVNEMIKKCKEISGVAVFTEIDKSFLLSRKPLIKHSFLSFSVQHRIVNVQSLLGTSKNILATQDITIVDEELAKKMKECFKMETKTRFAYNDESMRQVQAGILGDAKKDPLVADDEIIIWESEGGTLVPYKIQFDVERMKVVIISFMEAEKEKQIRQMLEGLKRLGINIRTEEEVKAIRGDDDSRSLPSSSPPRTTFVELIGTRCRSTSLDSDVVLHPPVSSTITQQMLL
ncbi:MAG: GNAT family N-acetyltransferase [Rickettsiales bacterium]|nr:GNAT family N-acetyltransferase [Rickettsiales bacterium]